MAEFEKLMGLMGIQLIGTALALFFTYYSFIQFRKKIFGAFDLGLWAAVWGGLLFASVFPASLTPLLQPFAFIRVLDFLVISAILVLFVIAFVTYKKLSDYRKKTDKLVQTITLKKSKKKSR